MQEINSLERIEWIHFLTDNLKLFISFLIYIYVGALNLSLCRNLRHYTVEESLWCRALHAIFTCYRGKTLNFLKIFWRPGSTFSELAALRIQGRGTVAFIHSGINEKSVWRCFVYKVDEIRMRRTIFILVDSLLIIKYFLFIFFYLFW